MLAFLSYSWRCVILKYMLTREFPADILWLLYIYPDAPHPITSFFLIIIIWDYIIRLYGLTISHSTWTIVPVRVHDFRIVPIYSLKFRYCLFLYLGFTSNYFQGFLLWILQYKHYGKMVTFPHNLKSIQVMERA